MWYIFSGVLLLALDTLSKIAAVKYLEPINTLPIWEGVFHLTYYLNSGAGLGILSGQRWLLIIVTILIILCILWFFKRQGTSSKCLSISLMFLLSGAVGNLIDRIFRGFVVDFFDFRLIGFPIFNVADICVSIGAVLLVIYTFFVEGKKDEN